MEASGCFHPFCTDCVAKYIESKVIHDNMSVIKCPNTSCSVLMDALSCRSILPRKVFEKWCRVLCESAVLLDASKGGFVHGRCFCPNRKCSELVLNECTVQTARKYFVLVAWFHGKKTIDVVKQTTQRLILIWIETMFCSWR
ncbi:hypothetical protein MKW92_005824 [Papaver armeniacum]|nr:hypothetical protein MKW92_005824 [Papaver armeniacum]